jgi:uncharacterized membrane protein YhhN
MIKLRTPQKIALAGYVVLGAVNLCATGVAADPDGSHHTASLAAHLTRPLLMPLLAVILWLSRPRPRDRWIVVVGLGLAAAGDVALMIGSTAGLLAGMVLFLGTHVAYIAAFIRGGAIDGLRAMPVIGIAYTLVFVLALVALWGELGAWRVPVAVYGLALTVMAACAATFSVRIGAGGGLFLASDVLIAVGIAHPHAAHGVAAWVMLTYVVGQALISTSWTRVQVSEEALATDTQRATAIA